MCEIWHVNSEKLSARLMATIQLISCMNDLMQHAMVGKLWSPCSSQRTNTAPRKPGFWLSELWCTASNSQKHVSKSGQLNRLS